MMCLRKIITVAAFASAACVTEPFAEALVPPTLACPAGTERVPLQIGGRYRAYAFDQLDSRGGALQGQVPECPGNRFPIYRSFTEAEGKILDALVETTAYHDATETMRPGQRVLWIEEKLKSVTPKRRVSWLSRDLHGLDGDAVTDLYREIVPVLIEQVDDDEAWKFKGAPTQVPMGYGAEARAEAMAQIAFMQHHIGHEASARYWLVRARRALGSAAPHDGGHLWRRANLRVRRTEACLNSPAKYRADLCSVGGVQQFSNTVLRCLQPHTLIRFTVNGSEPFQTKPEDACKWIKGFSQNPATLAAEINSLRAAWPLFDAVFGFTGGVRSPLNCDVQEILGLDCENQRGRADRKENRVVPARPVPDGWEKIATLFPDLAEKHRLAQYQNSVRQVSARLANCLEVPSENACRGLGNPRTVLTKGASIKGFVAQVEQTRADQRRQIAWEKAVCDAHQLFASTCRSTFAGSPSDAEPSEFADLAIESVRQKKMQQLADCDVLKVVKLTPRQGYYWACNLPRLAAGEGAALRENTVDFEAVYVEALATAVRDRTIAVGRSLAGLRAARGAFFPFTGRP